MGSQLAQQMWIVDSLASCHVCNDHGLFVTFKNFETPVDFVLGDGHSLKAVGRRAVALTLKSAQEMQIT